MEIWSIHQYVFIFYFKILITKIIDKKILFIIFWIINIYFRLVAYKFFIEKIIFEKTPLMVFEKGLPLIYLKVHREVHKTQSIQQNFYAYDSAWYSSTPLGKSFISLVQPSLSRLHDTDLRPGEEDGGGASSEEGGTAEEALLLGVERVDLAGDDMVWVSARCKLRLFHEKNVVLCQNCKLMVMGI